MTVYIVKEGGDEGDGYIVAVFTDAVLAQQCADDKDDRWVEEQTVQTDFSPTRVHTCAEPERHGPLTPQQAAWRDKSIGTYTEILRRLYPQDSLAARAASMGQMFDYIPNHNGVFGIKSDDE